MYRPVSLLDFGKLNLDSLREPVNSFVVNISNDFLNLHSVDFRQFDFRLNLECHFANYGLALFDFFCNVERGCLNEIEFVILYDLLKLRAHDFFEGFIVESIASETHLDYFSGDTAFSEAWEIPLLR